MIEPQNRIFNNIINKESPLLERSLVRGDWQGTADFIKQEPAAIAQQIKDSGLKGRGGAFFMLCYDYFWYFAWFLLFFYQKIKNNFLT